MTQPTYAGQPLDVEEYRKRLLGIRADLEYQEAWENGDQRHRTWGRIDGLALALSLLDEMTPQPPVKHRAHVEAMLAEAARRLEAQGRS